MRDPAPPAGGHHGNGAVRSLREGQDSGVAKGTLRYWAAARAAAGIAEEAYDATTLAEALDTARSRHSPEFARVLIRCSFLVDDNPVGTRSHETVPLSEGGTVEVLPPFAGG